MGLGRLDAFSVDRVLDKLQNTKTANEGMTKKERTETDSRARGREGGREGNVFTAPGR